MASEQYADGIRGAEKFVRISREFSEMQVGRANFASQWDEIAALILPTSKNTFFYGNYNTPGEKKTQEQIDSNGMVSLSRFSAICGSLLTPPNQVWHTLKSMDPYLDKQREVRIFYEEVNRILFRYRYNPTANFSSQNLNVFQSLGAFGTASMFIDELDPKYGTGLRYRALPLGETFFRENHQGMIDSVIRWFRWTARQAAQFAELTKNDAYPFHFPEKLLSALESGSENLFNFLHYIAPRDDYDPRKKDARGMKWESALVCVEGGCVCREGGYRSFPLAATRYDQTPGETYGRGPAMMVLPTLKTLNAMKRTSLKAAHRAVDPVILTFDDGLMNFNMRPGAINPGGMNQDGNPLVGILPTGNYQVDKDQRGEEVAIIQAAFLTDIYQMLRDRPQMTATEVIEYANERGILLGPTLGRQQSEYLGPLVQRELDVLAQMDLLPDIPDVMREAGDTEYEVVYQSPMAKMMRAQEASGMARMLEVTGNMIGITQDPSYADWINGDVALPAMADVFGVPTPWVSDPKQVEAKRAQRAQQMAQQQAIQALPTQAAMVKATEGRAA